MANYLLSSFSGLVGSKEMLKLFPDLTECRVPWYIHIHLVTTDLWLLTNQLIVMHLAKTITYVIRIIVYGHSHFDSD